MAFVRHPWRGRVAATAVLAGLTGCVAPVAPPPAPLPLIAIPGPGKTEQMFRQDDAACRADAAALPFGADPASPSAIAPPTADQTGASADQATPPPSDNPNPVDVYLRCMAAHHDVVRPLTVARPGVYDYYGAFGYPLYAGYDPFLYDGFYGFGFYGGCCGYRYGGYRFGGYRGGGGGFRGGGGGGRGGGGGGGGHGR